MPPPPTHAEALSDMLTLANRAVNYLGDLTVEQLRAEQMVQDAIYTAVMNIGNASECVDADFKEEHDEIPWHNITNMRHRLAHAYYAIDLNIQHDTVRKNLPGLIAFLEGHVEQAVPEAEEGSDPEPP